MKKLLFVMTAGFFSIHVHAQSDTTLKSLDEAVVTATKFERKQSQTGKVVTVISKEVLEKSSGKTVAQVLNEQAGITVNGSLNNMGTVQTVYMRGASTGRVLILIDGIPVGDPSMIGNEFDLNFISVHDIERIEILKGAQSTLYGSDAIAGAINLITIKKDSGKKINLDLTSVRGNKHTIRDYATFYGKLKNFEYKISSSLIRTNGFSSAYDSTGTKNFDRDGYRGRSFDLSIKQKISNSISGRFFFRNSGYDADIDANVFLDEKDYFLKNRNWFAGGGLWYKKNRLEIKANYQYGDGTRKYNNDSLFFNPAYGIKYERNRLDSRSQFAELYGNYKAGGNLSILAGSDYRWSLMSQEYYSISFFGPFNASFGDTSMKQASLFASLLFNTTDKKFNLEAGARYNKHSRYGSNITFTFNPSYLLTEHWRVFGSIASGFKSPSIYQLYDAFSGNKELKPEESMNYEAGIQYLQPKLNARLVGFYREIENGIDFNYNSFKYYNFTSQRANGVELEIQASPFKSLQLGMNYTYTGGNEKTQSRKDFIDTTYNYFLRRPKHSLNLTAGYSPVKRLYVSASLKHVSKRFDTGGFMSDDLALDSYTLLNAYAEYKRSRIKLFADFQNITGKKFFDVRGYNSIPFLFSVGIGVNL
jgi:vitamin B12 transporter